MLELIFKFLKDIIWAWKQQKCNLWIYICVYIDISLPVCCRGWTDHCARWGSQWRLQKACPVLSHKTGCFLMHWLDLDRWEGNQTMGVQTRHLVSAWAKTTRLPQNEDEPERQPGRERREKRGERRNTHKSEREKICTGSSDVCRNLHAHIWICSFIWKQLAPTAQIKFWCQKPNWRHDLALSLLFLHIRGLPGPWDLISCISRNLRRQEVRPSLCSCSGHPPPDSRLLRINNSLNFLQEQNHNSVV